MRILRSGSLLVAAAALTAGVLAQAVPGGAAEQTVTGAAYGLVTAFVTQHSGSAFSDVAHIANLTAYRTMLSGITTKVDPTITPVAVYDPNTKTITFSRDPRTVPVNQRLQMGETVWHELTHAIEDERGDIGSNDSEAYAERNVDYMTSISTHALPVLVLLERTAANGGKAPKLAALWAKFTERVDAAASLPSTSAFPVSASTLSGWFGFTVSTEAIKQFYLSGGFLPGKPGEELRKALNPGAASTGSVTRPVIVDFSGPTTWESKPETYSVTVTGGTPPYHYTWLARGTRLAEGTGKAFATFTMSVQQSGLASNGAGIWLSLYVNDSAGRGASWVKDGKASGEFIYAIEWYADPNVQNVLKIPTYPYQSAK